MKSGANTCAGEVGGSGAVGRGLGACDGGGGRGNGEDGDGDSGIGGSIGGAGGLAGPAKVEQSLCPFASGITGCTATSVYVTCSCGG